MTFAEILTLRRSIRNYKDKPVPENLIMDMIKETTMAPNAGNEQPWEFLIVNNKNMIKKMSDESKKNILDRIAANPNDYAERYRGMLENDSFNVYYNAPCVVIILGPAGLKNLFVDCALAASYLMLAATSRGLGTCWVNLGTEIKDPELVRELGIPEHSQIVAPIALGYPAKIPSVPKRKEPKITKIIS